MSAHLHDNLTRREHFVGVGSRALVGTPAALGAGIGIEQGFPGILLDPGDAEFLDILEFRSGELTIGSCMSKKDVGGGGENVHVL